MSSVPDGGQRLAGGALGLGVTGEQARAHSEAQRVAHRRGTGHEASRAAQVIEIRRATAGTLNADPGHRVGTLGQPRCSG
jgi:hypothetical protein